ncbi:MAG: hypothetical protein ACTSRZ_12530 [Promethearchaeota archaeon]
MPPQNRNWPKPLSPVLPINEILSCDDDIIDIPLHVFLIDFFYTIYKN